MSLFLYFKVKVTPWINVLGNVSHQKVKICHISVPCNHIITINGSTSRFYGMGNLLVPLVLWFNWTEKQTLLIWPSWFDLSVTLRWPCYDLEVTPLSSRIPTHVTMCTWVGIHHMYLKYWPLVQTWQLLRYLVHVCHMRKGDIRVIWWGINRPPPSPPLY